MVRALLSSADIYFWSPSFFIGAGNNPNSAGVLYPAMTAKGVPEVIGI
jgi:hypothetical protein